MALTIRNIDDRTRLILDDFKLRMAVKTDTKALMLVVSHYHDAMGSISDLAAENEKLKAENSDYHRILFSLEESMVSAVERLKQKDFSL